MDAVFAERYSHIGRPSIAPEKLLRALLLQVLYILRSERQLMEQLDYNLLFRWFVGLGIDDAVSQSTKLLPFEDQLKQALISDSYRPKRERRAALKLLEEL